MTDWMIGLVIVAGIIQWATAIFTERDGTRVCAIFIGCLGFCFITRSVEIQSIGAILGMCGGCAFVVSMAIYSIAPDCWNDELLFGMLFTTFFLIVYVMLSIWVINPIISEIRAEANIIQIETPEIQEERYEIFSGDELVSITGNIEISNVIKYIDSSGKIEDYYIVLCKMSDGDVVNVIPVVVNESDIEIIPLESITTNSESEYLLEITETYYREDRNQESYEVEFDSQVVKYKLYLRMSTIDRIPEFTN